MFDRLLLFDFVMFANLQLPGQSDKEIFHHKDYSNLCAIKQNKHLIIYKGIWTFVKGNNCYRRISVSTHLLPIIASTLST